MSSQKELDNEWIDMVTKFGCDNTIKELEQVLGNPEKIEVWETTKGEVAGAGIRYPIVYFFYHKNRFAFRVDFDKTTHEYFDFIGKKHSAIWYKNAARDRLITKVHSMVGSRDLYPLCPTSVRSLPDLPPLPDLPTKQD